jgi:HK97 family phage major capsid protein
MDSILRKKTEDLIRETKDLTREVEENFQLKHGRPPVGDYRGESDSRYEAKTAEGRAFGEWFRKGILGPSEAKVLTIASDPSAGFMCPSELSEEILHALTEGDPVRKVAKVLSTSNNSLEILKKSASGTVVKQATETTLIAETTGLAYAKLVFTPVPLVYLLQASNDFLADSAINVEAEIAQELGEAFGAYDAADHTAALIANCGDGTLNTYAEKHGGSTSVISADSILNLTYQLPTRFLSGAKFMMNRVTLAYIRTIKDVVTGAYMWSPTWAALGGGANTVETLCGYPIVVNDEMPAMTSALYPILFGDFSKAFAIVDRTPGFSVQRLAERYAEYAITAYLARFRTISGPLVGEALVAYQMSA